MAGEGTFWAGQRPSDDDVPQAEGAELVERRGGTTVLGIEDTDMLLHMAETADKRAEAYKRIKLAALRLTAQDDWVDQGGAPYLTAPGAEKVADVFRLSWAIKGPIQKTPTGAAGHFIMSCTLVIRTPWGREIEVIGTRSSSDPFYAKKGTELRLIEEIDEADVAKGAYTNGEVGAITRILGLRGLTWEDLAEAKITKDQAKRVDYRGAQTEATPEDVATQTRIKQMLVEMNGGNEQAAMDQLEKLSAFSDVRGVRDVARLRGKRLEINLDKVSKLYTAFQKAAGEGAK